jgi:hypothetical protein
MRVYAAEVTVGRMRERGLRRADRCWDVPTFLQSGCTFVATRLSDCAAAAETGDVAQTRAEV